MNNYHEVIYFWENPHHYFRSEEFGILSGSKSSEVAYGKVAKVLEMEYYHRRRKKCVVVPVDSYYKWSKGMKSVVRFQVREKSER